MFINITSSVFPSGLGPYSLGQPLQGGLPSHIAVVLWPFLQGSGVTLTKKELMSGGSELHSIAQDNYETRGTERRRILYFVTMSHNEWSASCPEKGCSKDKKR